MAKGEGGRRCNLEALRMFRKRERAKGRKATGRTMVQIP